MGLTETFPNHETEPKRDKVVFVFPGQGSHFVKMGKDLLDNSNSTAVTNAANLVYEEASDVLGINMKKLCFEGPEDELNRSSKTQPAIVTTSIAVLEAAKAFAKENKFDLKPDYVAGLSLGETTAMYAGGYWDLRKTVEFAGVRGEIMEKVNIKKPGSMLMTEGFDHFAIRKVCERLGVDVGVIHTPNLFILSGNSEWIAQAKELFDEWINDFKEGRLKDAEQLVHSSLVDPTRVFLEGKLSPDVLKRLGANVLNISIGSHSSNMSDASVELEKVLTQFSMQESHIPIIMNVDAQPTTSPDRIRRNFAENPKRTVRWYDSVNYMIDHGAGVLYEFGPSASVTGVSRRMKRLDPHKYKDLKLVAITNSASLKQFVPEL